MEQNKNALVMTALHSVMAEYSAGNSPITKYNELLAKMDETAKLNPDAFRTFGFSRN